MSHFYYLNEKRIILLGRWTVEKLDYIMHKSSNIQDVGERIEFLSGQFLSTEYKESTLSGDINSPEVFVVNLEGVDCLTFIEYIEAMRLSGSFPEFIINLKRVRYRMGMVVFERRNHFFTDWGEYNLEFVGDVTAMIGGPGTIITPKRLNMKGDGTYIIPGIDHKDREIKYIPASAVDDLVMAGLKTGDYAGIYSDEDGLDVSHVGIIIRMKDAIYLRHASSQVDQRKVIDEDFKGYIAKKQGLVVLRPKRTSSQTSAL